MYNFLTKDLLQKAIDRETRKLTVRFAWMMVFFVVAVLCLFYLSR